MDYLDGDDLEPSQETSATQGAGLEPPRLWNPNAAASWSLLLTPAFGSFLHARNADVLGRTSEAKANRAWFYISLAYSVLVLISEFFPSLPDRAFSLVAIVILLAWYFSAGRRQVIDVKYALHDNYRRKPWTKPLLIGFGGLIAFVAAAVVLGFLVDSFGGS